MNCVPILDLPEIIKLSGKNMRPFVEGSEVTQHGIVCIGETKTETENFAIGENIMKVFALIMQSSGTADVPHVVKLSIKRGTPNQVVKWWCSCTGGNGRCKHTLGAAFRLFRLTEETLEPISCTDTTQQWGKSHMKKWSDTQFKGTAVENMCHFVPKSMLHPTIMPWNFGDKVRQMFTTEGDTSSEFRKFRLQRRCTEKKISMGNVHKTVIRALKKVSTCPLKLAIVPVRSKNANKKRQTTVTNTKPPGTCLNKENQVGHETTTVTTDLESPITRSPGSLLLTGRTYSRRLFGNIQPTAGPQLAVHTTSPSHVENLPSGKSATRVKSPQIVSNDMRGVPMSRKPSAKEEDFVSFLCALGTIEKIPDPRQSPMLDTSPPEQINGRSLKTPLDVSPKNSPRTWNHWQPLQARNCGKQAAGRTEFSNQEVRREQWIRTSRQRLPPPPASFASREYVEGLLQKSLGIRQKNAPQFSSAEDEMYFLSEVCVTPTEAAELCFTSINQSSSDVWSRERKKRFTASRCYSLFTPKAPVDDEQFWKRKLLDFSKNSFHGNFNTHRGLEDEAFARRRYEAVFGTIVNVVGLVVHPDAPWLGCSPDGIIGGRMLLEVKSPEGGIISPARDVVKNLSYIKRHPNGDLRLSNRHPYYGQVQLSMALTGLPLCHFVVYSSFDDSIAVVKVPFDSVFVGALVERLTTLYFKYYVTILREAGRDLAE